MFGFIFALSSDLFLDLAQNFAWTHPTTSRRDPPIDANLTYLKVGPIAKRYA